MKILKLLGLSMVGAIVAVAFVGAGSASATVLCKENKSPCGSAWPEESTIVAKSANAVLLGTLKVECESSVTVLAERDLANEITGRITALTWSNCKGCTTVKTTKLPSGRLTASGSGNGTLLTTSETVVVLEGCPFGAKCTARANDASLTFNGGSIGKANAVAAEVPVVLEGFACGGSGKWDAGSTGSSPYIVTSVNGLTTGSIFVI